MKTMILRERTEKDESLLEDLDQRQEVREFIGGGLTKPREKLSEKLLCEKVIETDGGVFAGIVAVFKSEALPGYHELLCALLPDHEGHGLATKACRLMIDKVSYDLSVHRVIGCVDRENTSSLALINRLGGIFLKPREGIAPDQDIYVFKCASRPKRLEATFNSSPQPQDRKILS